MNSSHQDNPIQYGFISSISEKVKFLHYLFFIGSLIDDVRGVRWSTCTLQVSLIETHPIM